MDANTMATIMFLAFLCMILGIAYMFYAIFNRIIRAFTRTTMRTMSVFTGKPYRRR